MRLIQMIFGSQAHNHCARFAPAVLGRGEQCCAACAALNQHHFSGKPFAFAHWASKSSLLSIAKACPYLDVGGSLEVSELMQMTG
jgi:hypothetical protein